MKTDVLLVEDDDAQAALIREVLRLAGGASLAIQHAASLRAAIARLTADSFDAVLLDLNLPDSRGLKTFRRLMAACPAVPVVVLTSLGNEEVATQAVREGAQDYLIKGEAQGGVLVRAVQYAIERHRRRQAEQQLLEVQETERKRVARELHDSVIQSLVTMRLQLQMMAERLEESHPQAAEAARIMASDAAASAEEVRRISRDLHPQVLDSRRLHEAIQWYGHSLQAEVDAQLAFDMQPHAPLDPTIKQHLFRVFQETMRNALQHARASKINVVLRAEDHAVVLTVEDNGCGFDVDSTIATGAGLGLTSIRERVQLLGGSLRIDSEPRCGTLIVVRVPLNKQSVAERA